MPRKPDRELLRTIPDEGDPWTEPVQHTSAYPQREQNLSNSKLPVYENNLKLPKPQLQRYTSDAVKGYDMESPDWNTLDEHGKEFQKQQQDLDDHRHHDFTGDLENSHNFGQVNRDSQQLDRHHHRASKDFSKGNQAFKDF